MALHFARDVRHLVERRRDEPGEPNQVGALLLGALSLTACSSRNDADAASRVDAQDALNDLVLDATEASLADVVSDAACDGCTDAAALSLTLAARSNNGLAVSELVDAAERLLLSRLSGALGEESSR